MKNAVNLSNRISKELLSGKSVNLVSRNSECRELFGRLDDDFKRKGIKLGVIEFGRGATSTRRALVEEILRVCGFSKNVPPGDEDLVALDLTLRSHPTVYLMFSHFELANKRVYWNDMNLCSTLRHLMTERRIVILIQSRIPFASILPPFSELSPVEIVTVEI